MSHSSVKQASYGIVRSSEYVNRWFDAANFFNTTYTSELLPNNHFITCDNFMSRDIWALRQISGDGIDTIFQGDSEQDCLDALGA